MDIFLHLDESLISLVQTYEWKTYFLLFIIIFLETACIFTPFLPGNTLLFAAGMLIPLGLFSYSLLILIFSLAAILGSIANYYVGVYAGSFLLKKGWLKQKQFQESKDFYKKYGDKAMVISRFLPYLHLFVPLFAAISGMNKGAYMRYNFIAALIWAVLLVSMGYFLGQIPFIQAHFSLIIYGVVSISLIPIIIHFIARKKPK